MNELEVEKAENSSFGRFFYNGGNGLCSLAPVVLRSLCGVNVATRDIMFMVEMFIYSI